MTIFYVSPSGNDSSSGTSVDSAFATLSAAINAMAADGTADTTYVLDGTYYLNGTGLSLTSANNNDTIAAYQGANPVISGGTPVSSTGWTVGSDGIWSIHLNISNVEQLTVNGQSQTLAQYPNEVPNNPTQGAWLWAQPLPNGDNPLTQMAYNPADFSAGPPTVGEKVTVFDANDWSNSVLTITGVNTATHVITFDQPATYDIGPGSRYFVSNSQALIDQPGEWYFNQATQTLYYNAPADFNGAGAVVSGNLSLINISNAQNITIHGLTFSDAGTNAETDDLHAIATAAININSSTGIVVDSNNFTNVAQGIRIAGTSDHNTVSNSVFNHIWAQAIDVGNGTSQNTIIQNSIQNSGEVFATSGAIQLENSWNNIVSNNLIQNVPRFGISDIQWDSSVKSGANVIQYNTILNSGQATNDTGAIYVNSGSDSSALGDTIAYNTINNAGGLGTTNSGFVAGQYWSAGIYMDSGSSGAQIYGNLISGTTNGGVFLHGGSNNNVYDNIISGNNPHPGTNGGIGVSLVSINGAAMTGNTIHNNIIQLPSSQISLNSETADPSSAYQNIYYSASGVAPNVGGMTFGQWLASIGDQGSSVVTDPGFENTTVNDYKLIAGSYALTHGFQDLPWAQMAFVGPQNVAAAAPSITSFSADSGVVGDHITNDSTLTLTGTAEANSTVNVFDGATQIGTATADVNGAWSFITAALTNGIHSFTATDTDAAGNTSTTSAALSVTIDTIAPVAPAIASFSTDSGVMGDHITNDKTLTLTGTAEANSTVNVYDGATKIGSTTAGADGTWSFITTTLTNGVHSFTATDTDSAGNTSVASTALSVTIDATAPGAPSIASFSTDSGVVGDHITNDNTLTLTGTAEANSTVKIFDGATLLGTATAAANGTWSFATAALTNGAHSFTATDTDAAGNTSTTSAALSVTIDTIAPVAPAIASFSTDSGVVGDHITNDNTLTLTGTAEANSTVKIFDGATLLGTATAAANGTWSFATAALTNGAHSFTATDTDAAGNTSAASAALSVTIDTTAPIAPAIASFSTDSGVVGDHITNDNTLTLTGTAEANSTVKIFDGATLLGTATAAANGTWSFATAALTNGAHSFTATDTDTAGNTSAASAALAVTVDTVAPGAPVIVSDAVVNTNEVLLTGTAETNSTVNVFDGTTKIGTAVAGTNGMWSFTTASLTNGAHSFTATDTDTAGNTSLVSQPLDPVIGAIESNGLTSLTQVGNEYFLYNSAGSGPALKAGGAPVVVGQFVGWTPLGAEQTANGYQVVWKMAGADQYSIFNADSNGNYLSNTICAGTSFLLESIETSLQQDLNGDGHIGLVSTTIESNGLTSLTQVGNEYFLYNSAGSGPALKAGGAPVVVGQFVGWTPLGAEQTANGYQVVWKMAGADQYSIFNADSNGNYLSNTICAGTSFLLESIETSLQQDLNGDGHIGLVSTTIESNGLTSLTQVGNEYFLYNSAGSGPALKAGGAPVVVGQFVGWTPLGAEQTANGYQVVWKMAGADQYSIFNADSNGNYLSNTICAGTSFLLESIETSLQQDLNGDGHIGLVSTTIESNGLTSLTQVGNEYFLYNSAGSGPALKAGGAPVVVGQFVGWTPLGAEQTANGYQVVWKMAGADQYSIFNADSNGNYLSNTICAGTSFLLESIETSLQQDLNGDGHIGLVINAGATLELSGAESGAVTFSGSTGVLKLDNPASFHGSIAGFAGDGTLLGSDQIDLSNMTYNSSIQSNSTYNGSTGVLEVNNGTNIDFFQFVGNYSLANFKFASDGHGGTTVYDPPTTGLENVGFNSGAASGSVHNYVVSAVDGPSSSSSVTPSGAASSDVIKLGVTNNLVTGNAGNDTFVFNSNIGKNDGIDTQGVDAQHDVAHFISNAFNDLANVLSHAAQAEPDSLGTGHAIDMAAVKSVQHSDLQQNNIHIV